MQRFKRYGLGMAAAMAMLAGAATPSLAGEPTGDGEHSGPRAFRPAHRVVMKMRNDTRKMQRRTLHMMDRMSEEACQSADEMCDGEWSHEDAQAMADEFFMWMDGFVEAASERLEKMGHRYMSMLERRHASEEQMAAARAMLERCANLIAMFEQLMIQQMELMFIEMFGFDPCDGWDDGDDGGNGDGDDGGGDEPPPPPPPPGDGDGDEPGADNPPGGDMPGGDEPGGDEPPQGDEPPSGGEPGGGEPGGSGEPQ